MAPGILAGGAPQSVYFPESHEAAGCFKGMKIILEEQGFGDQIRDLGREPVSRISLPSPLPIARAVAVFAERLTYSKLRLLPSRNTGKRGFEVLLPKFQPELNFIEQCWGCARRDYCQLPASSREEGRPCSLAHFSFLNRSIRSMDTYHKDSKGRQAV